MTKATKSPKHRFDEARAEVRAKSDKVIERETAKKWAARAVACYEKYASSHERRWLVRAENYKQEAIEHGALAEDGKTLTEVKREMSAARSRATKARK